MKVTKHAEIVKQTGPAVKNKSEGTSRFADALNSLSKDNQRIERSMKRASRQSEVTPQRLIELQLSVYRYTQRIDLASRAVDQVKDGLKSVLQSQQ